MLRGCLFLFSLLIFSFYSKGQTDKATEKFIISVVSKYKNPFAYYPIRKDIFLPTEAELEAIEKQNDNPDGARVTGSFIFLSKSDSLNRDLFIDANGELMFPSTRYRGLSQKSNFTYLKRKQNLLTSRQSNLGWFLWYNQQFKALKSTEPEQD